jgi:ornithine cyclodeaminase/alanine dehydrogenase-like protein (mu-crystallin family)
VVVRGRARVRGRRRVIESGATDADHIHADIGELVAAKRAGRQDNDQLTVYKSVRVAVQDAAAATLVLEAARRQGVGTLIDL